MRIFQGVGAALLLANSAAILTDAFPPYRRGSPSGSTRRRRSAAPSSASCSAACWPRWNWRLIFLVSVPIGLFGTIWVLLLAPRGPHGARAERSTGPGNVTFAVGLVPRDGRDHVRDRALRAPSHGVDELDRPHRARPSASPFLIGVLLGSRSTKEPMFRLPAVQDPGLHRRRLRQLPRGARARRPDVHV